MKVKLGKAVKMFFGKSSLEMVYFEAVANSLDADATEIRVEITMEALDASQTLEITVTDNGIGFTEECYKKFSNLFDTESVNHKGLGRLVYLSYFDTVRITSYFEGNYKRQFDFTEDFTETASLVIPYSDAPRNTSISMSNCTLERLYQHSFVEPNNIKQSILEKFYSRLFHLKSIQKSFCITITSNIDGALKETTLTAQDIPSFAKDTLDIPTKFFYNYDLYYSIEETQSPNESYFIASIAVDNRNEKVEIISEDNIPEGYKIVFLLYSQEFDGQVDSTRQNLTIDAEILKEVKTFFKARIVSIIEEKIPTIAIRNKEVKEQLIEKYPHLGGYFGDKTIGYIPRKDVLAEAQERFFKEQKAILDATTLSDEQYLKAIELSGRALTEYILFRQRSIEALRKTTRKDKEAKIHNIIVPMKEQFNKNSMINDIYRNNAWMLDDKYMTYEAVLSDKEMGDLISYITDGEIEEKDDDRPDIALVFSNNPKEPHKFDIVIVELKKRGLSLEANKIIETQLEKRARKLMQHYENRIQRIWYYGIVEFNEELELSLLGSYRPLYSSGKMYYDRKSIVTQITPEIRVSIDVFIWDLDAVINDADLRNSTFLKLIKSKIREQKK